jgi:CarboxypepD_reg-like domain/Secretion system C-terminal sorting domain
MKKGLFTLTLLCSIIVALSAQKTVTGTVLDEKGEPLVGASVMIKGASVGAITDVDGHYSINASDYDTLFFSFVGFNPQKIKPNASKKLDVIMEEGLVMNDLVVIGYHNLCKCVLYANDKSFIKSSEDCLRRCCCFLSAIVTYENWFQPINAKPFRNGSTLLNYQNEVSWIGKAKNRLYLYSDKVVKYQISKSTDDVNYKIIGTSQSDTTLYVEEKTGKTLVAWGGSQFLDKERNKAELTYYLVEGYLEDFVEKDDENEDENDQNTEGPNTKERTLVYSKKISVEGSDYLKINTLFNESNQLALSISSPLNEVANFRIVDMAGRVLTTHQQSLLKENNTFTLAHNDLPAGMYILHVQQGEQTDSRKFTITK